MSANVTDVEDMVVEPAPGQSAQVSLQGAYGEALAPPSGHPSSSSGIPVRMPWNIQSIDLQVQFPIANRHANNDRGLWVEAVRNFIDAFQPCFSFLESTARTKLSPTDIKRAQLLYFSQQVSDALESLVLNYASRNLLTLDETDPDNLSHFCTGCIKLERLNLSITVFRYCKPTPYLARVNTGVFKRMRWNIERLDGAQDEAETKYYFLCYEDFPNLHTDGDNSYYTLERMWFIGQWVQVKPDPDMENILDWVLCDVPEGAFQKLLFVGRDQPSSNIATDHLLQLLTSQQNNLIPANLETRSEVYGGYCSLVNEHRFGPGAHI